MKVYNFNDDSEDIVIGTQNIDRVYGGRGGKKVACKIDGEYYLIKMPNNLKTRETRPNENIEISYNNSPISEYIGSHIYNIIGIKAHETILGIRNGRFAVACKDFRKDGEVLQHFSDIKISYNGNSELDENTNGNGAHLSSILEVIRNSNSFKNIGVDVESFFWEMFVVDFLIGNIDRNNGNWGVLKDEINNVKRMAPVYDNGNCLNNLISDEQIQLIINENKFDVTLEKQLSFFVDDNETPINMYSFLKSKKEKKLSVAIKNIVPKIDIKKIDIMIDDISNEIISDIRKKYYKMLIMKRYKECLIKIYNTIDI